MLYQISYDLISSTADYTAWHEKIKSLGPALPMLRSTWLVSSEKSAEQITDALYPTIQKGDRFLVSQIETSKYNGWHTQSTWDWIRDHLQ